MSPTALGVVSSARVAVASGPVVPTAGLVGWYDADDAASFTYFSGSSVRQWNDKSGLNKHATVSGDIIGNAPTRVAGAINGKAGMDFKSSGVMVTTRNGGTNPFHMFIAVKTGAATGGSTLIGGNSAGAISLDHSNATMRLMSMSDHQAGASTTPFTADTPTVFGVSETSGGVVSHYLNGVANGTGTDPTPWYSNALVHLGGVTAPNASPYFGYVGEYLFYNRVLTEPERAQVENYLLAKWVNVAWSPSFLMPFAWYDADNAASFTYSTGSDVASWGDRSGNGYTMLPTATKPVRDRTLNGRSVVRFATANLKATIPSRSIPITVLSVLRNQSASNDAQAISFDSDMRYGKRDGFKSIAWGSNYCNLPGTWAVGVASNLAALFNGNGTSYFVSDASAWGSAMSPGPGVPVTRLVFGENGAYGPGPESWNGDIAEVVFINRAITNAELAQWTAYCGAKWGTPGGPITEPFQFIGVSPSVPNAGTVATFTNLDIGVPHANRVICVAIAANLTDSRTPTLVTIGGITATIDKLDGFGAATIAHAIVPTGTTATVVATYNATGGPGNGHCCAVYRAVGPVAVVATAAVDYATGTGTLTLNTVTGGSLIACVGSFNNNGVAVDWTSATEDHETSVVGGAYPSKTSSAHVSPAVGPSTTVTVTVAATTIQAAAVSFSGG